MITDIKINKPEAFELDEKPNSFNQRSEIHTTIASLLKGEVFLVKEFYQDGLTLLKELHKYLKHKLPNKTFIEQREYRAEYRRLSNQILLEVKDQNLVVKKAPRIGWLQKFYPKSSHFFLSFPQVQGLNSSWQWYKKGVSIPVLRNKLHPYYGTYFPTRFEHLILLDNWLKRYKGPKKTAIEVGVGCGVLSLQMVQHQFQKVFVTDTNPNAIVGLKEFIGDTKLSRKIELDYGNLFGKWDKQTELIVFNPPWLPESVDMSNRDAAIYYNMTLFPRFFAEAKKRLLPEGKLLLIFSNIAQINNVTSEHPIEKEITEGKRFKLERCYTKSVGGASSKTSRDQNWRPKEIVELWELSHS